MMEKPIHRVKKIIDYKNISISAFEKATGMSNNSIQIAIKRESNLKDETLNSILNTYNDISAEWLLTGEGSMLKNQGIEPKETVLNDDIRRIKEVLLYTKQSKNGLGVKIGDKNGMRIQYVENGRNLISEKLASDIVNVYNEISYKWLLTGQGEMLEKQKINFDNLPIEEKLSEIMKKMEEMEEKQNEYLQMIYKLTEKTEFRINMLTEYVHAQKMDDLKKAEKLKEKESLI